MLLDLLKKNRSYRRFFQNEPVPEALLRSWVANCTYCASARNAQPLRYAIVRDPDNCARIFPFLKWAGYLKDWDGPEEGERPAAYLVQLLDTSISENCMCDDGIHIQTLMLSAVEAGFGGCIIKAFQSAGIAEALGTSPNLKPLCVLALGRPKECVRIEPMVDGDVRYWRTPDQVHHVPKRNPEDLIAKVL